MGYINIANRRNLLVAAISVCLLSGPAFGVVLHPSQSELTISEHPLDAVLGRWIPGSASYGPASCVAVHPDYILTTRHQGFASGTTVQFDINGDGELTTNETFKVVSALKPDGVDMMLCKIENLDGTAANLVNYVSLFTARNETNKTYVIGGYGKVTGDPVANGYLWSGTTNDTLTWGTNIVNTTSTTTVGSYTSSVLVSDFDSIAKGTSHEAAIAEWDSGGGWFISVSGEWQLAGLSAYVSTIGESIYIPADTNQAIRVSTYIDWIISNATVDGDADMDWDVDADDLAMLLANFGLTTGCTWAMGDFNGDGKVNDSDLNLLLTNYGYGTGGISSYTPPGSTPEPGTAALLAIGAAAVLRRRRRR